MPTPPPIHRGPRPPRHFAYAGSARGFAYRGIRKADTFECRCGWSGSWQEMARELWDRVEDGSCPTCDTMLAIRQLPFSLADLD